MVKRIPISDDAYWKLLKLKAELKCETWTDLVEKIYEMVFRFDWKEGVDELYNVSPPRY